MDSGDPNATGDGPTVASLVDEADAALRDGDAHGAAARLHAAAARWSAGAEPDDDAVVRIAGGMVAAARITGDHAPVLVWLEETLPRVTAPRARAMVLRAQLASWSRLDTTRALALEPEAYAAAEALGDDEGLATVLAQAAFAAYRRGDVKRVRDYADRAAALTPTTRAAQYQALRARMFASTTAGDLEAALEQSIKLRALARELSSKVDIANESNNLAEIYLELGFPHEARACAETAERLATELGHAYNATTARIFAAVAAAEAGDVDAALAALDAVRAPDQAPIVEIEAACAHAYWLLERGAAGDAARARERAASGLALAERTGAAHRLTALHASLARAHAREANHDEARAELELARRDADKVEPTAHSLLALAAAEVMSASESPRQVILATARARILRAAARREDPHAFCAHVRINRRLLELTGGVPEDLPGAS